MRQLPADHAEPGGLHLTRRLRVVPEISEGARVRAGSAESASRSFEQRIGLVERSLGGESGQVESLGVSPVRGDERLDRRPRTFVAELALHDFQDLVEAVARELDESSHTGGRRAARALPARVEGFPSVHRQGAHVTRLDALLDHVAEEGFEQGLRETGGLPELEARTERGEELPFDRALCRLLDPSDLGEEAVDPPLGRDEQAPRALVEAEDERLVRPEFLPELEHRALGFVPRRHHAPAGIADGQLRMCPMPRRSAVDSIRSARSVLIRARHRSNRTGFGRIRGSDRIAHADLPSDEDLGAKSSSVNQTRQDTPARQAFQMGARFAQPDPAEPDAAHDEFPTDEMVQGHASSDDVPTRLARRDGKFVIAGHRLDRLRFDQGDFPGGPRPVGVRAGRLEVAVTLETFPRDRPYRLEGSHRVFRLRRDVNRDDFPMPRSGARHAAVNGVRGLTIPRGPRSTYTDRHEVSHGRFPTAPDATFFRSIDRGSGRVSKRLVLLTRLSATSSRAARHSGAGAGWCAQDAPRSSRARPRRLLRPKWRAPTSRAAANFVPRRP